MHKASTTNSEKMSESAKLILTKLRRTRDNLGLITEFSRKQRKQNESNWNRLIAGTQSLVVRCSGGIEATEMQTLGSTLLDLNMFNAALMQIAQDGKVGEKSGSANIVFYVRETSFNLKKTLSKLTPSENYLKDRMESRLIENITTL